MSTTFFFFNDTATTEIYTLSLHDALPICSRVAWRRVFEGIVPVWIETPPRRFRRSATATCLPSLAAWMARSEEHTSELQSRQYLVCRLLLEKKKLYLLILIVLLHFGLIL